MRTLIITLLCIYGVLVVTLLAALLYFKVSDLFFWWFYLRPTKWERKRERERRERGCIALL